MIKINHFPKRNNPHSKKLRTPNNELGAINSEHENRFSNSEL